MFALLDVRCVITNRHAAVDGTAVPCCVPPSSPFRCIRKLAKKDYSFVVSVRPSAWNNSAACGQIFFKNEIVYLNIFRKSVEINVTLTL